jgi:hypothetical protein
VTDPALRLDATTIPLAAGRELLVGAWRDDTGAIHRIVLASRWSSEPGMFTDKAVTLSPEALPLLRDALAALEAA